MKHNLCAEITPLSKLLADDQGPGQRLLKASLPAAQTCKHK